MSERLTWGDVQARLWELTLTDWNVSVSTIMTEPVCATVSIWSDNPILPRLDGFIGTSGLDESARLAGEYLLRNLADPSVQDAIKQARDEA